MLCFCYAKTLSFFFASDPLVKLQADFLMWTLFQHYCASLLGLHGCFVLYFSIFFPEDFKASCSTELQGMTEDGSHFYVDQFQSSMSHPSFPGSKVPS